MFPYQFSLLFVRDGGQFRIVTRPSRMSWGFLCVPLWLSLLPSILRRLRTLLQHLAVPDRAFASVAGQLEILRQLQRVGRTSVLAQSAKHAAAQVVSESRQLLAPGLL